jgi:hypothetical protein
MLELIFKKEGAMKYTSEILESETELILKENFSTRFKNSRISRLEKTTFMRKID